MFARIFISVLLGFLSLCTTASAAESFISFSADAYQQAPQQPPQQAKMYVSENAVRSEYSTQGGQVVEIVYRKEKKRIILFPEQKSYREELGIAIPDNRFTSKKTGSPCEGVPNVTCTKLADEKIGNIETEKWEFISNITDKEVRTLHWLDKEHRFPVKQNYPDGTISELRKLTTETINNRVAQKWQLIISRPNGVRHESFQWYDPELRIAIREEIPGGYIRELRNILTGKLDTTLFTIPEDFKKLETPRS